MDNGYGYYNQGGGSDWKTTTGAEFQEDDVWGVFRERNKTDDEDYKFSSYSDHHHHSVSSGNISSVTRRIPKSGNTQLESKMIHHNSAPVNIPDWSKIYGTGSRKSPCLWQDSTDSDTDLGFARSSWETNYNGEYYDPEEDEEEGVIPPHEWIAKKMARNKISSFSVFEGAGRTLKGRDLCRVRNAVLTKTGFLESKSNS